MRVQATIEWVGGDVGWSGTARVPGRGQIAIRSAARPGVVRRRIRRALSAAGIDDVELDEELRIPAEYERELRELEAQKEQAARAVQGFGQQRVRVLRRLVSELHMSEKDAAALMGITGTYAGNLLKADSVDTDRFQFDEGLAAPDDAKAGHGGR